ncbi:hypothetical protein GCM10008917_23760 [Paraclostridium tenue]|uniref:DUF3976 domain-containing protein n=1 Tax=Paraclostridium tenue TaxID=1737 RepID=A0ABN1M8F4_9FIRM
MFETLYVISILLFIVIGLGWIIYDNFKDFYIASYTIKNKFIRIFFTIITVIIMLFIVGLPYKI